MNPPPDPAPGPSTANAGFTHTALYHGVGSGANGLPTYPGHAAAAGLSLGRVAFGKYEVVRELGEGGMGRVFEAVDRELGRAVAIKVLKTTDPFEASRFRGEAELIARLDHPNIVKIYDIQTTPDGQPYLVLEFAEGGSLDRELQGQPQVPRRAAETVETLSRALQYAFDGQKVIHRDLKPANVLRGKDGVLKVTDFGLAKQLEVSSARTPSGAVLGTPSYMAPEQADGKVKEFGPAVDVYGLGAILYELLTGRPPFRGVNLVETLEQVRWADPAPPSRLVPRLPRDLSTICLKCLSKAPGRRYASAAELAADLRRWLNGETIVARPAPAWERAWRGVRRRPWQAATAAVTGLAAAGLVVGGLVVWRQQELRAADRQLQAERTQAQTQLDEQRARNEQKLRERGERSLKALNGIRDLLVSDPKLSRTPGLDPLNRALADYYQQLVAEQQAEEGYDPAELAGASVKVGDLIRQRGDKARARLSYRQAEGLYERLAARDPTYRPRLAGVRLKLCRVGFELGEVDAAEKACDATRALWDDLLRAADTPETRGGAAEARHLKGEILAERRDLAGAAAAYRDAIALLKPLAAAALEKSAADLQQLPPDARRQALKHLRDLARGYGFLGDVLLDARLLQEADEAYWSSHHIREVAEEALRAGHAGPADEAGEDVLDAQLQLSWSWVNFANFQARSRALGTARHFAGRARLLQEQLTKANPSVVEYRLALCGTLNRIADLSLLLGDRAGVDALLLEARKVPPDDLSAKDGHSVGARGTIAESHVLRAQLLADTDRELAKQELAQALPLLDELCRVPQPRPKNLFLRAAALTLQAEFAGTGPAEGWRAEVFQALAAAVEKQYREKNPRDVLRLRAFRKLDKDERFERLVRQIDPD